MAFTDQVKKYFSFLETEYRFAPINESDNSIEFKNSTLSILLGWHKGEVDIDFHVHTETPILRPYRTRMFRLTQVAQHKDPQALLAAPRFPNYITTEEECAKALHFASGLMKRYCEDILKGDIKIFEDLAQKK